MGNPRPAIGPYFYQVRRPREFRTLCKRALSSIRDTSLRKQDVSAYLSLLGPAWSTVWDVLVYGREYRIRKKTAIAFVSGIEDLLGEKLRLNDWFVHHYRQDKAYRNPPRMGAHPSFVEVDECLNGNFPVPIPVPQPTKGRAEELVESVAAKRFKPDERTEEIIREREADYGKPSDNHERTARLWTAYLTGMGSTVRLRPVDVCFLNILTGG